MESVYNLHLTIISSKDRVSGRLEGSVSACELSMEANAALKSDVTCELRPPDLSGAPLTGDTFEDQMMGVSVLATEDGQKVGLVRYLTDLAVYQTPPTKLNKHSNLRGLTSLQGLAML